MKKYAVGLMSGTSLDGVDAALVEIEGHGKHTRLKLIHFSVEPFTRQQVDKIKKVISVQQSNVQLVCELNAELGYIFANAVKKVCFEASFPLDKLDFIASHGQTVYHSVHHIPKSTLQIGEPAVIAFETNTLVVSNFRTMDIAAGGEGAPLVPYSEFVLYGHLEGATGLLNLGGIGNITVLSDKESEVFAFDTGPGNMIIDELMNVLYQKSYDEYGRTAAQGIVSEELLIDMMKHPYFEKPVPKSTGREMFGIEYTHQLIRDHGHLSKEDLVATATCFTAKSVADAYRRFIKPKVTLKRIVVGGGGALNPIILKHLQEHLIDVEILTQEDLGYSSQAKEAIAFAVLGNQTIHGDYGNVPGATGASRSVILGNITPKPRKDYDEH